MQNKNIFPANFDEDRIGAAVVCRWCRVVLRRTPEFRVQAARLLRTSEVTPLLLSSCGTCLPSLLTHVSLAASPISLSHSKSNLLANPIELQRRLSAYGLGGLFEELLRSRRLHLQVNAAGLDILDAGANVDFMLGNTKTKA